MCETRVCQFCINGQAAIRLTDGTYGHEFTNPERGIAWFEPCREPDYAQIIAFEAVRHAVAFYLTGGDDWQQKAVEDVKNLIQYTYGKKLGGELYNSRK